MGVYTIFVNATANAVADTEDAFIDIAAPASVSIFLTKVKISVRTAASDARVNYRILRKSAIGAGSAAGTEVQARPLSPAPVSVATIKNAAVAYAAGTVTDILDDQSMNARSVVELVPREGREFWETDAAQIVGVNILSSVASLLVDVTVTWEE